MMNNVYDVLNENARKTEAEKKPRFSREEYASMMKEKRQALFTLANEQTLKAVGDPRSYLQYLQLQSRLDYTVTNTLLVMAQKPNATLLKDRTHWREENKTVRKDSKGIEILEPGSEYVRRDGTTGINYNPKEVYDVSQLNGKEMISPLPQKFEYQELVSAVLHRADIKPEVVSDQSQMPTDVYYDEDQNALYVKQGLEPEVMVNGLIREYCYIECVARSINRDKAKLIATSAGYMLSQKYGLNYNELSFAEDSVRHFSEMSQKEIKNELEGIKSIRDCIGERMEHGLYVQQQERNEKQERYGSVR